MPLVHMKKFWTPLELLGLELYRDDEGNWYSKRRKKAMKKLTR